MNLLIHDLNEEEWKEISADYDGWEIISDNGTIKPCVGCFGCWIKEPGQCVINDGYEKMGALIHKADEVTVISRYTYGGFSSFIKNVFDRSIGWVLPYFEVYQNEMHHKKRYPEDKQFTFIFRGSGLTEDDKKNADAYVRAVCRNLRGYVKAIKYEECMEQADFAAMGNKTFVSDPQRVILLNCSLRGDNANSKKFLDRLASKIEGNVERINLSTYINRYDELVDILGSAGKIVLGLPLYVDSIPSAFLRIMEKMEIHSFEGKKSIYVVSNMGLYESSQLKNLMGMVKNWCEKCGFTYGGGVAIGAGEMIGSVMAATDKGPARNATEGLDKLSNAVNTSSVIEDKYVDPYRFPRVLYMFAANSGWPKAGRINGLKRRELLQQKA
jgi:multimeric flavodoxin WrbA